MFGLNKEKPKQSELLEYYAEYSNLKPVDYEIPEEMRKDISSDVEIKVKEFASSNLIDEFSEGMYLDQYIQCRCNLIRNELRKQQLRHLSAIEGIESMIKTEILKLEEVLKIAREELMCL